MTQLLRGVATISLWATDHASAVAWYAEVLGTSPYFERPGYAEFRIGDHQTEVGIIDRSFATHLAFPDRPAGAVLYWHVDNVGEMLDDLLRRGATPLEPLQDRGHGFTTATVVDPFGNILGIMTNPHYLEMLAKTSSSPIPGI